MLRGILGLPDQSRRFAAAQVTNLPPPDRPDSAVGCDRVVEFGCKLAHYENG
jgi:hypothetical protein